MLIGQSRAESLLARALARGRVGHAYLFLGPTGSGKRTAARLFAQAINCERQPAVSRPAGAGGGPSWQLAPCGECASCRRIAAGTHPEVLEIIPDSKTGQDITVAQARQIRQNAALRPKIGERRVYILASAEALNETSANALLKTLEEPSEFTTLLLCAPNPSQVLPTILSRCQLVRFGLASAEELAAALTARGTTPQIAAALARASGGRPGVALSWAQEPAILKQRGRILDLFARAVGAQREAARDPAVGVLALRLSEELRALVGKEKESDGPARPAKALHAENLETALSYLRDLLLLAVGASAALVQNQDRLPELESLARGTASARVLDDIEAVREALQILDRNVAPQLVLERMFWAIIGGAVPRARPFEEACS